MAVPHLHHGPRFAPNTVIAHTRYRLRDLVSHARPWQRLAAVTALAALTGLCIGLAMPRGPVTSAQALALLIIEVAVGFASGLIMRSRWAMLLAPIAQIVVFELARLGASGPTVDGVSLDGMFGPLAFIVGRGFYGLVGVLPMVVAAAYGAHAGRAIRLQSRGTVDCARGSALYLRRGVAALAVLVVVGLVYLLAQPASVPPIRDASGKVVPGSIASLEKVRINGSDQWIEIRAWSPDKPVLLSIPGGPGQSDLALSRPTLGTLAKDFVVVSWDQRGIGKSYASYDPRKLTTKQAVADTIALTNYLRKRFDERKIYLFGESGGSVIDILAVQQHPELYHAWIGSGQMVNPHETDQRIYHDLLAYAATHHDTGLASTLRGYGPPPYRERLRLRLRDDAVRQARRRLHRAEGLHRRARQSRRRTVRSDGQRVHPAGEDERAPRPDRHLLGHLPAVADDRLRTHRRAAPRARLPVHRQPTNWPPAATSPSPGSTSCTRRSSASTTTPTPATQPRSSTSKTCTGSWSRRWSRRPTPTRGHREIQPNARFDAWRRESRQ